MQHHHHPHSFFVLLLLFSAYFMELRWNCFETHRKKFTKLYARQAGSQTTATHFKKQQKFWQQQKCRSLQSARGRERNTQFSLFGGNVKIVLVLSLAMVVVVTKNEMKIYSKYWVVVLVELIDFCFCCFLNKFFFPKIRKINKNLKCVF